MKNVFSNFTLIKSVFMLFPSGYQAVMNELFRVIGESNSTQPDVFMSRNTTDFTWNVLVFYWIYHSLRFPPDVNETQQTCCCCFHHSQLLQWNPSYKYWKWHCPLICGHILWPEPACWLASQVWTIHDRHTFDIVWKLLVSTIRKYTHFYKHWHKNEKKKEKLYTVFEFYGSNTSQKIWNRGTKKL